MQAEGMSLRLRGPPGRDRATGPPRPRSRRFGTSNALGDGPKVLVLPGSRRSEIERLAPVFGEALRPVLARHPDAQVILPAAPPQVAGTGRGEEPRGWPGRTIILDPARAKRGRLAAEKRAGFAVGGRGGLRPQARSAWNLRPARRRWSSPMT